MNNLIFQMMMIFYYFLFKYITQYDLIDFILTNLLNDRKLSKNKRRDKSSNYLPKKASRKKNVKSKFLLGQMYMLI